ncbi:MAG: Chitooligosaccharide deacetylase ChbG [Candidatus Erwinia impunctatus]|nr:Chitooligosaccharide deacetylase ChbG [Culicoides impunctatus]
MQRLLIVNADDFGLCKGQNFGIIDAFQHGVVTSTTALVNGAAIDHAVMLAKQFPALGVGLHFTLTHGAPQTAIPTFSRDGVMGKWFWDIAEKRPLPEAEIALELHHQYRRFISLFGSPPTHIDSHHHVHMTPAIFPLIADFCRTHQLALRLDRTQAQRLGYHISGLISTAGFSREFYGEDLTEQHFLRELDLAQQHHYSSLEIMTHPAFIDSQILASQYHYPRFTELELLTSSALRKAIADKGFRLGSFRDLASCCQADGTYALNVM